MLTAARINLRIGLSSIGGKLLMILLPSETLVLGSLGFVTFRSGLSSSQPPFLHGHGEGMRQGRQVADHGRRRALSAAHRHPPAELVSGLGDHGRRHVGKGAVPSSARHQAAISLRRSGGDVRRL
ncbi:hypothetical protein BH20PSE1_BH20PSE1_20410 [soil metagenome]